jgi:hypothetical protein
MCGLKEERIKELSKAFFTDTAHSKLSDQYSFVPTYTVAEDMKKLEWYPTSVREAGIKNLDYEGYQKHEIRFTFKDYIEGESISPRYDIVPQIVLVNGHDGHTRMRLHAGVNVREYGTSMVLSDQQFLSVSLIHRHYGFKEVADMVVRYVESFPNIVTMIDNFKSLPMIEEEKLQFARDAVEMRWPGSKDSPILFLKNMIKPRELMMTDNSLWATFNVISENIFKGGIETGIVSEVTGKNGRVYKRKVKTKQLNSIMASIRINKALWDLTMQYSQWINRRNQQ